MFLVGYPHIAQVLRDGLFSRTHNRTDNIADSLEDCGRRFKSRTQLFLEKAENCIDSVAEPFTFVIKQHQGRDKGHNAYNNPCNGIRQQRRREAPDA